MGFIFSSALDGRSAGGRMAADLMAGAAGAAVCGEGAGDDACFGR